MTDVNYEVILSACKKPTQQHKSERQEAYSDTLKTVKAAREN
jgi:hypothetical protein